MQLNPRRALAHHPVTHQCAGDSDVFVHTENRFLAAGLNWIVRYFMVVPGKKLYIVDRDAFRTLYGLYHYLDYLRRLKLPLLVVMINETANAIERDPQPKPAGILPRHAGLTELRQALARIPREASNIDELVAYYARHKAQLGLSANQLTMVTLAMSGMSVKQIAAQMGFSTKTIYAHLQRVAERFCQPTLAHLVAYLQSNNITLPS